MRKSKLKLQLRHETLKILTGPALERAIGGSLITFTIIGDTGPGCNPPPPHTNSIAPCCASLHGNCPHE